MVNFFRINNLCQEANLQWQQGGEATDVMTVKEKAFIFLSY
jgi:hypothetical protein